MVSVYDNSVQCITSFILFTVTSTSIYFFLSVALKSLKDLGRFTYRKFLETI
jgi:hypothetical protein